MKTNYFILLLALTAIGERFATGSKNGAHYNDLLPEQMLPQQQVAAAHALQTARATKTRTTNSAATLTDKSRITHACTITKTSY